MSQGEHILHTIGKWYISDDFGQLLRTLLDYDRSYLLNGISIFDQTKSIWKKRLCIFLWLHYLIFIEAAIIQHFQTPDPPLISSYT